MSSSVVATTSAVMESLHNRGSRNDGVGAETEVGADASVTAAEDPANAGADGTDAGTDGADAE